MKLLIVFSLGLLLSVFAQNAEFYTLDGRRSDPCVNLQKLGPNRPDCTPNSMQPALSNTYFLPSTSTVAYATPLTITGRFFGTAGSFVGIAPRTSPDSCGSVDVSFAATTTTQTSISFLPSGFAANWINRVATSANPVTAVMETYPRALCWSNDGINFQFTGFHLAVVFSCDVGTDGTSQCTVKGQIYSDPVQAAIYTSQQTCCPAGNIQQAYKVGQCRNTKIQTCCGSVPIPSQFKCCNESLETVAWADGTCPCYMYTITIAGVLTSQCPNGELCCLPTKYSELLSTTAPFLPSDTNKAGECYNPRTHRCCNTGYKYDPGAEQCCSVNGIQTLNVPCPCNQDSDCKIGGQTVNGDVSQGFRLQDMSCCFQTAPLPYEATTATCSSYANYPSGTGHYSIQQCVGQCIDTRFQICCNGRACVRQYERCCNTTCCNRFTGTCQTGTLQRGSSRSNPLEVNVVYDVCTTVEQIDLIRAWWMFVLPSFLLLATILCLAITLVFAGRVEQAARRALEKGIILAALINVAFATCTFFAPIYKYGIVIVFINLFAIIAAASRRKGCYVANLVLQLLLTIYLIDPFHGNDYFNLAVDRNVFGRTDPYTAGLWHSTSRIWDVPSTCYDFYNGYFQFDPMIRDTVRVDEPNNSSFGYCSRGWVSALLVFDGFMIIATIVQVLLAIIALVTRTKKAIE